MQIPGHFTGLFHSIYPMDRPFDLYGYYIKISLVVLPLDVLDLCVLRGIVLLRKYTHKSYTYIPPPVRRGYRKQTYLIYYMLDILFTLCVIIYKLQYSGYLFALVASNMNPNISSMSRQVLVLSRLGKLMLH
jgi:uncharacterized sodium:solute symporter family permease YidK